MLKMIGCLIATHSTIYTLVTCTTQFVTGIDLSDKLLSESTNDYGWLTNNLRTLKPGGYLELACVWPVPMSDDNTLPPDSAYVDMCMTFQRIAEKIGAAPDAPIQYKQRMIDAGFAGVTESKMKIPSTPWPKDRRLKKVGALEMANVIDGAQAFLLRGFTQEFGRSKEELEIMLMQMRKELMSQKIHSYVTL